MDSSAWQRLRPASLEAWFEGKREVKSKSRCGVNGLIHYTSSSYCSWRSATASQIRRQACPQNETCQNKKGTAMQLSDQRNPHVPETSARHLMVGGHRQLVWPQGTAPRYRRVGDYRKLRAESQLVEHPGMLYVGEGAVDLPFSCPTTE